MHAQGACILIVKVGNHMPVRPTSLRCSVTRVNYTELWGVSLPLDVPWPFAVVRLAEEGISVGYPTAGRDLSLAWGQIEAFALVTNPRSMGSPSVCFQLIGGGFWDHLVTRRRLQPMLELRNVENRTGQMQRADVLRSARAVRSGR